MEFASEKKCVDATFKKRRIDANNEYKNWLIREVDQEKITLISC